jgi:putative Holliday junction resolvase
VTRLLALDPGERRVGVALSDPTGTIAQPHTVLDRRSSDVLSSLRVLVEEYEVSAIVVGLPVSLDGSEGPAAEAARAFAEEVGAETGLPVVMHDERFTSLTARRVLLEGGVRRRDRRRVQDMVAATVLLQSYLDAQERRDDGERAGDG